MTGTSEELKARAQSVFKQALREAQIAPPQPVSQADIARLNRAVRSLPRTTREVFLANRREGLSYDEIASATGLSRAQVRRHMANALYRLARSMDGEERPAWQRWVRARLPRWLG